MPNPVIPIGGRDFEVVVRKGVKDDDGHAAYGLFDDDNNRIVICSSKNKTVAEKRSTAFHEAVHAALAMSGMREILAAGARDEDQAMRIEEAFVVAMENMLWPRAVEVIQRLK